MTDDEVNPARCWRSSAEVADLFDGPEDPEWRRTETESRMNCRIRGSGRPERMKVVLVSPVAERSDQSRWSRAR